MKNKKKLGALVCLVGLMANLPAHAQTETSITTDGVIHSTDGGFRFPDGTKQTTAYLFGGDGSAGDLVAPGGGGFDWVNNAPPSNPNFADITINVGGLLAIPAGTTLTCSGNFLNNGTLLVLDGVSNTGTVGSTSGGGSIGFTSAAHPGDSLSSATAGEYHNNSISDPKLLQGGEGGRAILRTTVVTSLKRLRIGGGSGGGSSSGGVGGGLVIIKCGGTVTNSGTIQAIAPGVGNSTGGGGGGIVVLASSTAVDNSGGIIDVRGAPGGSELGFCCAPGGGGGGGIVVSVAPVINNVGGLINVAGGAGVDATGVPTSKGRFGGGGGGASGGDGGRGGAGGTANGDSIAGGDGYILEIAVNPATIL